jgi:hypothetical protein
VSIHVFGIRHHGPGSARSLRQALDVLAPDAILVEGPPDADAVLPLAADAAMRPPFALLVYRPDAPKQAVFYPFAEFSPEWVAIRFALSRGVAVRFMDLPMSLRFVRATEPEPAPARIDPLAALATAAGYDDHEMWWEHLVERRRDPVGLFEAIAEAMQAIRSEADATTDLDLLREACMRQTIRAAIKEGRERIAVICGAWHAPALAAPGPAKPDAERLKGLSKTKVDVAWIPWTHSRLSYHSGYGAGIESPGWYRHLWLAPDRAAVRWLVDAARLLREQDLEAPSASVIEAARLADALAAMRALASPGLAELREAMLSVFCRGDAAPLALVRTRLEIGNELGAVPDAATISPLQRELRDTQRRLRLKVTDESKTLDLDLRNATDRERSVLFHRLTALGVNWGTPQESAGKSGTFHELWQVRWQPEMEVSLVEASIWGHTIQDAASARLCHDATASDDLEALTTLLDQAILSELPNAIECTLARVQESAALSADIVRLMAALPPLARTARYGDVRSTPGEHLRLVIDGLLERILVGLPFACASLDDEAADEMVKRMDGLQRAMDMLDLRDARDEWVGVLHGLADRDGVHGLVRGWCCRILFERQQLDDAELQRRAGLALSPAVPRAQAAAWLEGVLRGSGVLLLHLEGLWSALDRWIVSLAADEFTGLLPLVRRAFADFNQAERRAMGEKIARLMRGEREGAGARGGGQDRAIARVDAARAARVLPVLAHLLGVAVPDLTGPDVSGPEVRGPEVTSGESR